MSFARLAQKMSGPGASNRKWGAEDWLLPEAMDVSRWMSLDWTLLPIEMCRINDILKILKSKKEESFARCLSPLGRSWPRRMPNPTSPLSLPSPSTGAGYGALLVKPPMFAGASMKVCPCMVSNTAGMTPSCSSIAFMPCHSHVCRRCFDRDH